MTARTPDSLAELLAQHARVALQVSGADQTAWRGRVVEAGEGILGLAHWDGTLHLDRECILDPLREMYERSGEPQSDAALIRYREALVTLLHEQSHFLGPAGATQEAAQAAFKQPGSRVLEEGVAEAWAHDHLNDYLGRLGIDEVAPGITQVRSDVSYQAFVPAVRELTSDLDRRAGMPAGETLRALNQQTAEGQWALLVDRIYRSSRLPSLMPSAAAQRDQPANREPAIKLRLETSLRGSMAGLERFEPLPRGFAASRSKSAGRHLVDSLNHELTAAEQFFQSASRTGDPRHDSPQSAVRHALSGVTPPNVSGGGSAGTTPADVTQRARLGSPHRLATTAPDWRPGY